MQKSLLFLFFLGAGLTARGDFNGLATGGTLSGGTTAKTFTASSKVTTVR